MELKDFISVAGKSGLHTIVGKSKNNVIVESLKDKKRFPIFVKGNSPLKTLKEWITYRKN